MGTDKSATDDPKPIRKLLFFMLISIVDLQQIHQTSLPAATSAAGSEDFFGSTMHRTWLS
jgi:hypothetical protein